jgi:Fe-S-cluster containining protein
MSTDPEAGPGFVTANVGLSGPDWQLQARMTVPAGPARLGELLPLVQSLADGVVGAAVKATEEQGEAVSCKKGCGACCRQLVPIAEVEARRIRDLVDGLPEPRRSRVRDRFAQARRWLEAAGLLDKFLHPEGWDEGEGRSIGLRYFLQGIACPFLEDESSSIYEDRPIACREYLVTSPAENCARPSAGAVKCVRLPLKVWTAVARFDPVSDGSRFIRWVPLILAPEWADAHPDEAPPRPGPELLRELLDHLAGAGRPPDPGGAAGAGPQPRPAAE